MSDNSKPRPDPKNLKLESEEEAREHIHMIIVRGKLNALEAGLMTGLMLPGYVREEAAATLQLYPNLPEETKKRLTALLSVPDNDDSGSIH